jgi:hypothetical protein
MIKSPLIPSKSPSNLPKSPENHHSNGHLPLFWLPHPRREPLGTPGPSRGPLGPLGPVPVRPRPSIPSPQAVGNSWGNGDLNNKDMLMVNNNH